MTEPTKKPRRRRLRAALLGVVLGLCAFEVAMQIAAYALWLGAGRENGSAEGRDVVLCVGDSFTYGLGASSPRSSYPAQLQKILDAARPDDFHVVNGGRPGQSTADVLRRLPRQLAEHRPSVVVVLAGYNDRTKKPEPVTRAELAVAGAEEESFPLRWRTGELLGRIVGALRGEGPDAPSPASALYGTWVGTDLRVQFGREGICVVSGIDSTYRVDRDRLEIGSGAGAMQLRWKRRGEQLELSGGPLPEGGVVLDRAEGDIDPTVIGRRVLEDLPAIEALDQEDVERACAFLEEHPRESTLWWRVAAAATRGVGTATVRSTVETVLGRLPDGDPWRAGLWRIRAGLISGDDPDEALASILRAALVDGAGYTITSWIDAHAATEPRAAFDRALERVEPDAAERATLEAMFERTAVPTERVATVLTGHLELCAAICIDAGCEVVIATYPSRDSVVDPAVRAGAHGAEVYLADVAAAFDEAIPQVGWDGLFVVDGHCNDTGYGIVARTIADAVLALQPR